jgi:hypothetical protein
MPNTSDPATRQILALVNENLALRLMLATLDPRLADRAGVAVQVQQKGNGNG